MAVSVSIEVVEIPASLIPNISSNTVKGKVQHKKAFLRVDLRSYVTESHDLLFCCIHNYNAELAQNDS